MKNYSKDKCDILKLRLLASIDELDAKRILNPNDELLNDYEALESIVLTNMKHTIVTDTEIQNIVEFLASRGADEIAIEEMIDWCYVTGAKTIDQVDKCGYDWDWWDENGKLNYE